MLLKELKVTHNKELQCEWNLKDCTFDKINLIVGENATGKSRIISVIKALSDLFSKFDNLRFSDKFDYHVEFEDDKNRKIIYELNYENNKVNCETLQIDKKYYLKRDPSGKGKIRAEALPEDSSSKIKRKLENFEKGRDIEFEIDKNKISLNAKRDKVQHPFLELLYNWGNDLRFFSFGTFLGKDQVEHFNIYSSNDFKVENMSKDYNNVLKVFRKGFDDYKDDFVNSIKKDMKKINYKLEDIVIDKLTNGFPKGIDIAGIVIKESGLNCQIEQISISQGMFRALSLIIQLNYLKFASNLKKPSNCVLIDDIGEGLDYGRSSSLVNLLINYAKTTNIQLIMTTNDRFIMNNVPLEYWSIIKREGNTSKIYNYRNSNKIFDDFKYTGLNNFDFFSSKYYSKKIFQKG
jgi:AAA15 family ATPase/GTPase